MLFRSYPDVPLPSCIFISLVPSLAKLFPNSFIFTLSALSHLPFCFLTSSTEPSVPVTSLKPLLSRSRRHQHDLIQQAARYVIVFQLSVEMNLTALSFANMCSTTPNLEHFIYRLFQLFLSVLVSTALQSNVPTIAEPETPPLTITSRKTPQVPHTADRIFCGPAPDRLSSAISSHSS